MDYEKAYQKAYESQKTTQLVKQIITWDTEGQKVIGKVVAIEPFTDGRFTSEAKVYTLETNNGLVTCVLGEATDKQFLKEDPLGTLVAITFKGKKMLDDSRQCNIFDIQSFDHA